VNVSWVFLRREGTPRELRKSFYFNPELSRMFRRRRRYFANMAQEVALFG
jgi:hypothetical protein